MTKQNQYAHRHSAPLLTQFFSYVSVNVIDIDVKY